MANDNFKNFVKTVECRDKPSVTNHSTAICPKNLEQQQQPVPTRMGMSRQLH
jgi:hypothetical protein